MQMTRGPADDLRVAEQVGVGLGLLSKMATGMGAKMVRMSVVSDSVSMLVVKVMVVKVMVVKVMVVKVMVVKVIVVKVMW